jgi:flagellar biosynthesis regulator FlaF
MRLDVFLEFPNTNQRPFQIEQLDELKDGDYICISGVMKSGISQSSEDVEAIELHKKASTIRLIANLTSIADMISNDQMSTELNASLIKLTSQLSRLISRLDKQESNSANSKKNIFNLNLYFFQVELLAKQLAKSSEISNKQFTEIIQALGSGGSPHVERPLMGKSIFSVTVTEISFL